MDIAVLSQLNVYVDETVAATATQDGSQTYPYKDLDKALKSMVAVGGTVNFVGTSYTLTSVATFASSTATYITVALK